MQKTCETILVSLHSGLSECSLHQVSSVSAERLSSGEYNMGEERSAQKVTSNWSSDNESELECMVVR